MSADNYFATCLNTQAAATGSPMLSIVVLCTTSLSLESISSLQNFENSRLSPFPRRIWGQKYEENIAHILLYTTEG